MKKLANEGNRKGLYDRNMQEMENGEKHAKYGNTNSG